MIIAPRSEPIILSTNIQVIEAGILVYDPLVAYSTYDVVQINGTTNKLYKAIQPSTGISPLVDVNPTAGTGFYWFEIGSTNYKRAFDELSSSVCENLETIYYKFQVRDIDIIMLGRLLSTSVRIKIVNTDIVTTILDETFITSDREVYDWADWTYAEQDKQTSFFKVLPLAYNTTIEVWINNLGGVASVGHLAYGRSKFFGLSLIDPAPTSSRRGITSKTRDEWGNITTRRKARYRRMTITCLIDSTSIDTIEDRLESIVDTPCIFVGDERDGGYKALLVYGEMSDHDMPIGISKTTYQLEVEGYL